MFCPTNIEHQSALYPCNNPLRENICCEKANILAISDTNSLHQKNRRIIKIIHKLDYSQTITLPIQFTVSPPLFVIQQQIFFQNHSNCPINPNLGIFIPNKQQAMYIDTSYSTDIQNAVICVESHANIDLFSNNRHNTPNRTQESTMTPDTACIHIKNLRLRTYIGFNDVEKQNKQDVVINAWLRYQAVEASLTDDIANAVNYRSICKQMIDKVESNRFLLLEKMAADLLEICMENTHVLHATVEIDKPHALRFADSVSLTLTASRP
jgi:D-erythro-7,8-dihydroneopterin triphosphate epimerase